MVNVVFTGLYSENCVLPPQEKVNLIRSCGIENIYWVVWKGYVDYKVADYGVKIIEIEEPYPHVSSSIRGRQRQIFNTEAALKNFSDNDIVFKLRWDVDINKEILENIQKKNFFNKIENGIIDNKVWVGFYAIHELFSPSDLSFAGYKKDLDTLVNFEYTINNHSANNYVCHDGMMLSPKFIENNKRVSDLLYREKPDPWAPGFKESHYDNEDYLYAWAYNFYVFWKYFKTGPLGSCYFKRGDVYRWPTAIVDYDKFSYNFDTMCGRASKLGPHPRYRVYDDIFVNRLIEGEYKDAFANKLYNIIQSNLNEW
tara:strand:- start:149 stop:1084 length:936 start_codon:yes stop_codon:yes gene_type:complete